MRNENLYLEDISSACRSISDFVAGLSKEVFLETDLVQSAVIQKFTVIGEAASRIGDKICDEHPEIDWKTLISFRNFLVHVYFQRVWEATLEVDSLREHIDTILQFRNRIAEDR